MKRKWIVSVAFRYADGREDNINETWTVEAEDIREAVQAARMRARLLQGPGIAEIVIWDVGLAASEPIFPDGSGKRA